MLIENDKRIDAEILEKLNKDCDDLRIPLDPIPALQRYKVKEVKIMENKYNSEREFLS